MSIQEELNLLLYGKEGAVCTRCSKSIHKKDAKELDGLLYCSCCYEVLSKKLGGEYDSRI